MGIFAADGKVAVFLNRLGCLMVLNVLTIVCSIPIFTIGAAMTALYTTTLRMTRREDNGIIRDYGKAFCNNFKQATILWMICSAIILFMTFDIWVLSYLSGTFAQLYRILLFILILLLVMIVIHMFPVLARFENTTLNVIKNSALFCVGHIGPAFLLLLVTVTPIILLMISYRFVCVDILIGASGPAYIVSMYFTLLFRKYEKAEVNDNPQSQIIQV